MLHLHKGKFETPSGGKIETMEGGTKYHYENCNDPIYQELLIEQDKLNERIKSRELFLKTIPVNGMDIRHEDELVTIFPPYKTSTTTYKVTLAK
jgi:hypothetical protein